MPKSVTPERLTTARLRLEPLAAADVAAVHAIYADLGTWLHLPAGRHTTIAQAERMVSESEQSWAASGLGRWAIRLRKDLPGTGLVAGTLIGVASATLLDCGARNFGYRLTPASWGVGLATEAATVALVAAQASTYPVTARALAGNPASVRVLERIGLTLVWRGQGTAGADALGASPGSAAPRSSARDSAPAHAPAQPDTTVLERFIFADRPLAPELLAAIIRLG
ncbi:GNAT family N-acetyltransferase [Cryobacterium lactosi]|uniref:GNAT family N-acetyltransferase n=1 Tax=Cryobacterium lactosi TaxID=1259202 RepID=UPI00141AAAFE|nr:GNAT family protein [Cryobacterium lactosi]